MLEEAFASEDTLQELIADYPELLSGEQISPTNPRRWILIRREQGIADTEGGADRWALDHLLIDQDAVPTLVEVKRSRNPEIRRTIVGQMMEYAAHATLTWKVDDIRRSFEESNENPAIALAILLDSSGEPNEDEFWKQVETNLRTNRLRLLFVSDRIPDELSRVVEFLNSQMPKIEVLAVEIKQFSGTSGQTLVPRVIGRTAAPLSRFARGKNLDEQALIDSFDSEEVREAAGRLFQVSRSHGATYSWSPGGVSVRLRCAAWRAPLTVAWLYAPSAQGWMHAGGFIFGAGNGDRDFFERLPQSPRDILESWASEFSKHSYAKDVSTTGLRACSITHEDAAANIDLLSEGLDTVLSSLRALRAKDREPGEPSPRSPEFS